MEVTTSMSALGDGSALRRGVAQLLQVELRRRRSDGEWCAANRRKRLTRVRGVPDVSRKCRAGLVFIQDVDVLEAGSQAQS